MIISHIAFFVNGAVKYTRKGLQFVEFAVIILTTTFYS